MTLADKIFWFKCDNGHLPCDPFTFVPQIATQIGTLEFLNDTVDYLLDIIAECQQSFKQMGEPSDLEGFDQIIYADCVELHNRAVDLYNDLMERGIDIEIA